MGSGWMFGPQRHLPSPVLGRGAGGEGIWQLRVVSNLLTIPLDSSLFGNIASNRVQFLHYIIIRHSEHSVALIDKILRSCRIRKEIVLVTTPVQFNNEHSTLGSRNQQSY